LEKHVARTICVSFIRNNGGTFDLALLLPVAVSLGRFKVSPINIGMTR
jgi:hypothetical protein